MPAPKGFQFSGTSGSSGSGVTQITAGTNVTISPVGGTGNVTVNATTQTGAVASVFTRTGAVVATTGDYTAAQVTNAADKSTATQQTFTGTIRTPSIGMGIAAAGNGTITSSGAIFLLTNGGNPVETNSNILDNGNGGAMISGAGLSIGTAGIPSTAGTVATTPPTNATIQTALGNLALGTAFQNTLAYDVRLTIFLSVTVNTSGVVKLGVGTTNTPTQATIITGVTTVGFLPVTFKIPAGQFALLSISGTITDSIAGQYIEAV